MRTPSRHAILMVAFAAGCGQRNAADLSQPNVIYGDDDRVEVYQASAALATKARSTVALVKKADLAAAGSAAFKLPGESFGSAYGLCAEEPFREQPNPAFCSGFLVAPDLIATAGHCLRTASDCASVAFVFDFAYGERGADPTAVAAANVYGCKEILATQAPSNGADFAVVRLDRAVTGRAPLAFRREAQVATGAPLVVIGHPAGLPTKVAGGANVRTNSAEGFFVANLDTYGGNSGSAVFNADTGDVEGILVRGETDFTWRSGCYVSNRCASGACRGEDVTRATVLAAHVPVIVDPPPPPPPQTVTRTHALSAIGLAIPDNSANGAAKSLKVEQDGVIQSASVRIAIKHTYIGDLQVYLFHPDGSYLTLHDRTGGSRDDIDQTYDLPALAGKAATGTWWVYVRDRAALDLGRLELMELKLTTK